MMFGGCESLCDLETHAFLVALLRCLSLDCRIVGSLVDSMSVTASDSTLQTNWDLLSTSVASRFSPHTVSFVFKRACCLQTTHCMGILCLGQ